MREVFYNSNITPKAADELKLLVLYYDKVHVVNDAVYSPFFNRTERKFTFAGVEDIQFIPKSFYSDYKLLLDEKILAVTRRAEDENDEYELRFSRKISELINSNFDLIFPRHPSQEDARIITEEVYEIMKHMFDFDWGKPIEHDLIWWYYAFKLKWFLKLLIEGKTCISSSKNLNSLFASFIKETDISSAKLGSSNSLAYDAIKIMLPNPKMLSFEDVLELKWKLGDELENFKQTISSIEYRNKELFEPGIDTDVYSRIFYEEIRKPLKELETRLKNIKTGTFREFVTKLQNPLSYSPLLGTIVASMPIQYTLLVSMGLTSYTTYLKFKEDKRVVENNGLYFLLKLN